MKSPQDLIQKLAVENPLIPFSIDTRTLQKGDLFVALDGVNQKGHTFLAEAFKRGAVAALCAAKYRAEVKPALSGSQLSQIYFVEDPVLAMADLARAHRARFSVPVAGVAGSVGKTSTKQFLAYLLSRRFKTLATTGNLNNQLGLPIMLSRLRPEHQIAVLEMGADHPGDLKNLVQIAEPTCGILTPIAPEHLQGFGSLAGVYNGELELLLSPRLKVLVTVAGDSELDRRLKSSKLKIIRVGFSDSADVKIADVKTENGKTHFQIQGQSVTLPTPASFLVVNAGLAAAAAVELGMDWKDLSGDWTPEMPRGRFTMRKIAGDLTVIDDTYNSSPRAFSAALEALEKINFPRKWLVFSDMLELGNESARLHRDLAREISAVRLQGAWAFGPQSRQTIESLQASTSAVSARWFENAESAADALAQALRPGDLVLLKGSRGMKVERVLEILEARFSEKTPS